MPETKLPESARAMLAAKRLTPEERKNAWELGIQVSMLQAQSVTELHEIIDDHEAARLASEEKMLALIAALEAKLLGTLAAVVAAGSVELALQSAQKDQEMRDSEKLGAKKLEEAYDNNAKEMNDMRTKIADLEQGLKDANQHIKALEDRLGTQESATRALQGQGKDAETDLRNLKENDIRQLKDQLNMLPQEEHMKKVDARLGALERDGSELSKCQMMLERAAADIVAIQVEMENLRAADKINADSVSDLSFRSTQNHNNVRNMIDAKIGDVQQRLAAVMTDHKSALEKLLKQDQAVLNILRRSVQALEEGQSQSSQRADDLEVGLSAVERRYAEVSSVVHEMRTVVFPAVEDRLSDVTRKLEDEAMHQLRKIENTMHEEVDQLNRVFSTTSSPRNLLAEANARLAIASTVVPGPNMALMGVCLSA
eukprot:gene6574-7874_t